MQPIVVNTDIFPKLLNNYLENITLFTQTVAKLEKFHIIFIDDENLWLDQLEKIQEDFDQNQKSFIDNLIIKKLKYEKKQIDSKTNSILYEILASLTPDNILLSNDKISSRIKYIYSPKEFISDNYKPNNILFRIPKPIKVKPNYSFRNFEFIFPFIRDASKIEIMDKQLFKDTKNETEMNFIIKILEGIRNLEEIQLYWEPNDINIIYKKFLDKIKEIFPEINILRSKQYISRGPNHDRFIIKNYDELSIRFTVSFNNFFYNDKKKCYVSKAGFKIDYEKGRSFYD